MWLRFVCNSGGLIYEGRTPRWGFVLLRTSGNLTPHALHLD